MERPKTPEDDLIQKAEQSGWSAIANILRAQRDDNLRANRAAVLPTPPTRPRTPKPPPPTRRGTL
jgi:hypothetical protein